MPPTHRNQSTHPDLSTHHDPQDARPDVLPAHPGTYPQKGTTMNNRTKGVIAGIAGLALLTGGTTFALWSDTTGAIAGGTIINGNLDVAAVTPIAWYDTSADRTDKASTSPVSGVAAHAITDLTTWKMVPGDTVEGNLGLEVALSGDNLVANLKVATTATSGLPAGVTVTYDVYRAPITPELGPQRVVTAGVFGVDSTLRFAAPRAGQAAGAPLNAAPTIVVAKTVTSGTANVWVVVKVAFAAGTTGSTASATMNASTVLNSITATLDQVRTGADFM